VGIRSRSEDAGAPRPGPDALAAVLAYHERTKHHFQRFAVGPGELDWDTQPDPFRRYVGAEVAALDHVAPSDEPALDDVFAGRVAPAAVSRASVSQLFYDSLAISAWKRFGSSRWALRINPSSGNLHPTEGYLASGPIEGLCDAPFVAHYAPERHALEIRARFPEDLWREIARGVPPGALVVGLTSIHWREAWKYGERAFRYCQHDLGHAIGAFAFAAAGLGWRARLVEGPESGALARFFGVWRQSGPEREHAACALALAPRFHSEPELALDAGAIAALDRLDWRGEPNALSPEHVEWDAIDAVSAATEASPPRIGWSSNAPDSRSAADSSAARPLRRLVHRRRSAVAFDGSTSIAREAFFELAWRACGGGAPAIHGALPWEPRVDLALFVHRVQGLEPGLYWLARDEARVGLVRSASRRALEWAPVAGARGDLRLLARGDFRSVARAVSCHQEIAADGCFSLGMIADFERPLRAAGAAVYPRLFWECGLVGQILYLAAEAAGLRATGIGCFFDDPMHGVLGLSGRAFQSLYHLAAGGAVEDVRIQTEPPYALEDET
jgi:SagB-type dehydrogenase family enzyme